MTPPRGLLPAAPLPQLVCAFVAAWLVWSVDLLVGLGALAALAALWPPAVAWRPIAVRAVLARYLPYAVCWLAFVVGYLQVAHALGHPIAPQPALEQLAREGTAMPQCGLVVLAVVLLAPFFEELVFRGYLFTALATVLPLWAVQLVTAAAFGLVHGLDYALPIAVLALCFGWLRQRYQALLPSMFAHAVHNGITVAVTLSWPQHLDLLYPR